ILLVDDDKQLLEKIKTDFQDKYAFVTANSSKKALEILEENSNFAMIITKLTAPEIDGIYILSQIKTHHPSILRYMFTDTVDLKTALKCINKLHIFKLLPKPYLKEVFEDSLKEGFRAYAKTGHDFKSKISNKLLPYYDSLTGLPNRAFLLNSLDRIFSLANRTTSNVVILLVNIDNFSNSNDKELSNSLLKKVSKNLKRCIRKSDLIARIDNKKFIIVLQNLSQNRDINLVSELIIESFNDEIVVKKELESVTINIGISIFPKNGKGTELLLKKADDALIASKKEKRNQFKFVDDLESDKDSEIRKQNYTIS
ncbi:MAG: diguanylate cyclase, partial [Candidatus Cloacimonadota bacterium]|nr:diguanylate cyclase [Candidatus Cloacimonadota bacterium]